MSEPIGMVTFEPVGRMGNFLFKTASTIGYALKHGMPFTVPSSTKDPKWNPIYLQHLASHKFNPALPVTRIKEGRNFSYHELPFQDSWRQRNIVLDGYWQSELYFKEYAREVHNFFGYPWHPKRGVVSVHVRRTDYLELTQKHPPVTKEWYEEQMGRFPGFTFQFFSDDIEWCRQTFGHRSDVCFSVGKTEERDLVDMSGCEHHICSASTFSWWGAWLNRNPNKHVFIPKQWFQPGHGGLDTKDIVPPEWNKV